MYGSGDFLSGPEAKTVLPVQGTRIQSLTWDYIPYAAAKIKDPMCCS